MADAGTNCYCGGPEEIYPHQLGTGTYCKRSAGRSGLAEDSAMADDVTERAKVMYRAVQVGITALNGGHERAVEMQWVVQALADAGLLRTPPTNAEVAEPRCDEEVVSPGDTEKAADILRRAAAILESYTRGQR